MWNRDLPLWQRVIGTVLLISMLVSALLAYNDGQAVFDTGFAGFNQSAQAFVAFLATVGGAVVLLFSAKPGSRIALAVSLAGLTVLLFGSDFVTAGENRTIYVVTTLISAATATVLVYTTRNRPSSDL